MLVDIIKLLMLFVALVAALLLLVISLSTLVGVIVKLIVVWFSFGYNLLS